MKRLIDLLITLLTAVRDGIARRYVLSVVLSALVLVATSEAADFRAYVHWIPYLTTKEISWTPPAGQVDGYEYYLQQMENGRAYARATTSADKVNVRFRTHGHYVLWVRSYRTFDGVKNWSQWANSLDAAYGMVDGEASPWAAYVLLP